MFGHLDDVETELGFHHVADGAGRLGKRRLLEFRDHLAAAEGAQVAARGGAGAVGIGLGELGKVGAFEQLLAQAFDALALGRLGGFVVGRIHLDQDVGGGDGFTLGEAVLVFVVERLDFLVRGLGNGIGLGQDHLAHGHLLAHFGLGGARVGHVGFQRGAGRQFRGQLGLDLFKLGIGEADAVLGDGLEHDAPHDQFFDDALADAGQGRLHLVVGNSAAHLLLEHAHDLLDIAFGHVDAVDLGHHNRGLFFREGRFFGHDRHGQFRRSRGFRNGRGRRRGFIRGRRRRRLGLAATGRQAGQHQKGE